MGIKDKGLKSSAWNWLSIMINQLRNFIVSLILARLLEPEDFGLLGMSLAFAGFIEVFVDFGFGNAVIQKKEVSQTQLSTIFYLNMIIGAVFTLIMFFCAPLIANYFEMSMLTDICRVMSATFLVIALSNLQNALLKKKMDFKTPFFINLSSGAVTAVVGIVMAYIGFGVWSLVTSTVAGWCLTTTLLWIFNGWRPSFEFSLKSVTDLWKFGYKTSLTICIDSIYRKIDTLVIGKFFSASTLGFFYRAQSLNQIVVQYSFSSIQPVLFPALCEIKDDMEKMRSSVMSLIHIISFLSFFFAGVMYICADEIIVILFTEKWIESAVIFKILGLFTFVYTIPTVLSTPLMSIGESGVLLRIETIKKILLTLSIPIGIYYGLYGYIYATQIAAMIGIFINMYFLKKIRLNIAEQMIVIIQYAIPFAILIVLLSQIFSYIHVNVYAMAILKACAYMTMYFAYSVATRSRGLKIFMNSMVKPVANKLFRK